MPVSDPSYESARRLLTQLRTVARRLSAGLDPVSLASQMHGHRARDDRATVAPPSSSGWTAVSSPR